MAEVLLDEKPPSPVAFLTERAHSNDSRLEGAREWVDLVRPLSVFIIPSQSSRATVAPSLVPYVAVPPSASPFCDFTAEY